MFEGLVENALIVDIGLAVLAIEAAVLCLFGHRNPQSPPPADLIANLVAGAMLMLALRVAIADGSALAIVALMTLGGLAHGIAVYQRLRSGHRQ